MGRSEPNAEAQAKIGVWRADGVVVHVVKADVACEADVRQAIADLGNHGAPALRGVVHAAGVLDDGVLAKADRTRLARARAPRWMVPATCTKRPSMRRSTSSSSSRPWRVCSARPARGTTPPGNAYLDALASERRRRGLPALSLNWGPWAEAGMAARAGGDRSPGRGVTPLAPEPAVALFERLLERSSADTPAQLGIMDVDWPKMLACYPAGAPPLLRNLAAAAAKPTAREPKLRAALLTAPTETRQGLLEGYLTTQLARVMEIDAGRVDPTKPLNALGIDSLMVIELKNVLESDTGVVLPIARFLEGPSLAQLATLVLEGLANAAAPVAALEQPKDFPLAVGQRALWFLYQLAPDSTAYNVVDAVRFRGRLNPAAMRRALQTLIDRHPSLRTTFYIGADGEPRQRVHERWDVPFPNIDVSRCDDAERTRRIEAEVHTPFDLVQGPTARTILFRHSDDEHVLVFLLHHIVADIWSLILCTREFMALYEAEVSGKPASLPVVAATYAAFVRDQAAMLASAEGERHWEFWRTQLGGDLPALDLPTDHPRPAAQTFGGAWRHRRLSPALARRIKTLSEGHGATSFMTLLAGYHVLLHRYTGQDDLLVGCPTTGRNRAEHAALVGDFVNPVVIRARTDGNPSFADFLAQVRNTTLAAFDHQDMPFAALVERLQPRRDPSRSPIFQTMFAVQKAQGQHEKELTHFLAGESNARLEIAGLQRRSHRPGAARRAVRSCPARRRD